MAKNLKKRIDVIFTMKKILALAFFVRALFLFGPYHPDLGNHLDWGIKFWEYGPKKFYDSSVWAVSWPNQPPGTIYLWALIAKIKEIFWSVLWWLNVHIQLFPSNLVSFLETTLHPALVKLPSVLAEIGIGWLIYLILRKLKDEKAAKLGSIIFLFNPITIYNSAIWGQTEGIINLFGLMAIYFLFIKKPVLGVFSFIVSLYFKASLVIFSPIILILLLKERYSFRKILISFSVPILILFLISYPFITQINVFEWFGNLYLTTVFKRQGNMLTANAFNLWALLFGIDFSRTDQGQFLSIGFRQWGLGTFLFLNFPVVLILILRKIKWEIIFMALVLVVFSAFLFLTNMHERYLYPVFLYLAILAGLHPNFIWPFIVLSLIYFLNLYNLWFYPKIGILVSLLTWQKAVLVRVISALLLIFYFYFFFIFLRIPKSGKIRTR